MNVETPASRARQDLHALLWPSTIRNAASTPFYQALWNDLPLDAIIAEGPGALARMPLVTKAQLQRAGAEARWRDGQTCIETLSSGTTGKPFVTYRGSREIEFLRDFYGAIHPRPDAQKRWRRGVAFDRLYHGAGVPIETNIHVHRVSIYDAAAFDYAFDVLCSCHDGADADPWCTLLAGPERVIMAAIVEAERRYPDGMPCRLEAVITSGSYVSSHMRRRARRVFGAPITDRYSLSEIFGGASQTDEDEWYYVDPSIIAEVLDLKTQRPVTDGMGVLVLTVLYPFQQVQPMIRYNTGDVVDATWVRCGNPGTFAIKPKGRRQYSLYDDVGSRFVIAGADLYEIMERTAGLARHPLFLDAPSVADHMAIGLPKYRLSSRRDETSRLSITLEVEPVPGAATHAWRQELHDIVIRDLPVLADSIRQNLATFDVEIVPRLDRFDHMWG